VDIEVSLRPADRYSLPIEPASPVAIPELGIAYQVSNRVAAALEGTPAAKAGFQGGELVTQAKLIPPDRETLESEDLGADVGDVKLRTLTLNFEEEDVHWPALIYALQQWLPGTRVELTLEDERTFTWTPYESTDSFHPERGLEFEPLAFTQTATSFSEAVALGARETVESLTLIFRTLKSLGTGQVSLKGMAGPVGIAHIAYVYASRGLASLLIFLCLISANLAVINFLPIPLLDGGHMIFLAYEGIRGKPPSERVFVALSYLGLAFILLLMIWVVSLDIGCIPRR
jgi:regulator of sigma E protease